MKSASDPLVLRNTADLRVLLRGRTRGKTITLDTPQLPLDEQMRWQARLARDNGACGCETGERFSVVGLIAIVLLVWLTWGRADWSWLDRGLWAFGILLATGLAGKATGLWKARQRLRQSVAELSVRLASLEHATASSLLQPD